MNILICGPESSGKTTLVKQLSTALNIIALPEYARSYLEKKGPSYTYEDIVSIARLHANKFDALSGNDQHLLCDTFLYNLKIWSEVKYGKCDPWIIQKMQSIPFDLILLLKPNIPWKSDPLRESKSSRKQLFTLYEKELQAMAMSYYIIDAQKEERFFQAHSICKRHLR